MQAANVVKVDVQTDGAFLLPACPNGNACSGFITEGSNTRRLSRKIVIRNNDSYTTGCDVHPIKAPQTPTKACPRGLTCLGFFMKGTVQMGATTSHPYHLSLNPLLVAECKDQHPAGWKPAGSTGSVGANKAIAVAANAVAASADAGDGRTTPTRDGTPPPGAAPPCRHGLDCNGYFKNGQGVCHVIRITASTTK